LLTSLQEKVPVDLSATNDKAYRYKSERDAARMQVQNLQEQLQVLQQTLGMQDEMYNIEQSKAHSRIEALEAECTNLKEEIAWLNRIVDANVKQRNVRMNYAQLSESDQRLFDTSPCVTVPRNTRLLSHEYHFQDVATPTPDSPWSSESSASPESPESSYEYHGNWQSTYTSKSPESLLQVYHCPQTNFTHSYQQQDNILKHFMSLSQPTTGEPEVVTAGVPTSLSQDYYPFPENTAAYLLWAQENMSSSRSLPKELEQNVHRLSFCRSSSLGSARTVSQQTIHIYSKKCMKVVTACGESNVICELVNGMFELHEGERVVVQRSFHNEYGTVRALSVTIYKKPSHVGVELDLPGLCTNLQAITNIQILQVGMLIQMVL